MRYHASVCYKFPYVKTSLSVVAVVHSLAFTSRPNGSDSLRLHTAGARQIIVL